MSVKGLLPFVLNILWLISCFLPRVLHWCLALPSGSKEGGERNKDPVPLTEGPMHWPHLKAFPWLSLEQGKGSSLHVYKSAQAVESTPTAAERRPEPLLIFSKGAQSFWNRGGISPRACTPPGGTTDAIVRSFPSFLELPQEGTLGPQLSWLPGLLGDYSHLLPSSTECANQENNVTMTC